MTATQMRSAVSDAYKSQKWADRVKTMSDDQVVAIFLRLKGQGKV